jgi:hypothetical protein
MEKKYHYKTVIDALKDLNSKGFTYDFNLNEEDIKRNPFRYQIEHIYRYEGDSNPDDAAIVYGISSDRGVKGVFVAGFSAATNTDLALALNKIPIKQ